MATIDKQSLRESIESLKSEFDSLNQEGKVTAELQVLFKSLLTLMSLMTALFLERTTKKTSRNSSIPSSQTEKDETSLSHKGISSKGQRERQLTSGSFRSVEHVTVIPVESCEQCGEDLSELEANRIERRTKIDILFEKVSEHVDVETKRCPACGTQTKGCFPSTMPHRLQYGDGVRAFAVNLVIAQMVALARVCGMIKTLIGVSIAESTLLQFIMGIHKGLQEWEQQVRAKLLSELSLHCDETSCRVERKHYWVHVYCARDGTRLKLLHRKRGKEAIEAIGIIPSYRNTIIHDCWSSYLSYDNCSHALCGSHLLRELTHAVDANDYQWALSMMILLKETARRVAQAENKTIGREDFKQVQQQYRKILAQADTELPVLPEKPKGKRGKIAKSDAHNLQERLRNYEQAVLRFAHDPNVAFTNNSAERALRMGKVKQKVSGCFRSVDFAHAFCRISSYLDSMKAKGYNPIIALQLVLKGNVPKP